MSTPWVSGNYVATYVCDKMTSYVSSDAKRDTLSVPSNGSYGANYANLSRSFIPNREFY